MIAVGLAIFGALCLVIVGWLIHPVLGIFILGIAALSGAVLLVKAGEPFEP